MSASSCFFMFTKAELIVDNYAAGMFVGKLTLNAMKRLPNLNDCLWNGRPLPSIVLMSSGLITSPGLFITLIFDPSK